MIIFSKHSGILTPPQVTSTYFYNCFHPQEMVNLLLTGCAVSNVFDGNLDLDSGGSSKVASLCPIPSRVGSLTITFAASTYH